MKSRVIIKGSLFLLILFFHSAGFAQTPVSCGQIVTGSISTAGEKDDYTLTANAGDVVSLRAYRTSGGMDPCLELFDSTGALVKSQCVDCYWGGFDLNMQQTLAAGGQYTIRVSECGNDETGDYKITWDRLKNTCNASSELTCGQTVTGSLSAAGERDYYTLNANVGDVVSLRAYRTSGGMDPCLELFDSTGALVKSQCVDCYWGGFDLNMQQTLAAGGQYTVRVSECGNDETGDYKITWDRLKNTCNASAITCGQNIVASLSAAGKRDYYTFSIDAGNMVRVRVNRTSGGMDPCLELFDSTGVLVKSQCVDCYWGGSDLKMEENLTLGGQYTARVSECGNDETGDYNIKLLNLSNPCNTVPVPLTLCTKTDLSIASDDILFYNLTVPASDNLFVTVQKKEKAWNGSASVTQGGQNVVTANGSGDYILHVKNPQPGDYILQVNASDTGDAMIQACTNLPVVKIDELFVGTIYHNDGYDWAEMDVPAGVDRLDFTVETVGNISDLDVWRESIDSSEHWSARQSFNPPIKMAIQDPASGKYYLRVSDHGVISGGSQIRDYSIMVQALQQPPPPRKDISISPSHGGNTGQVTVTIFGHDFIEGTTAKLVKDGKEIIGTNTTIVNSNRINTTFDLAGAGAPAGLYNLVITLPNSQQLTCENCFTVEEGGEAKLWVEIVGPNQIRIGRQQLYLIKYGNSGLTDSERAVILIGIPNNIRVELSKSGIETPLIYEPDIVAGEEVIILEAFVNHVPVGSTGTINAKLLVSTGITEITLKGMIVTDELSFANKLNPLRTSVAATMRKSHFSSSEPTINVEILDAKGSKSSTNGVVEKRHPYFILGNEVYTQVGLGSDRYMTKMTLDEFNNLKNNWGQLFYQDGIVLYCGTGKQFVSGNKDVTQQQYDTFKLKLEEAVMDGQSGKHTSENCMQQPDGLAEQAGIPDGFISQSAENVAGWAADDFCKAFGISDYQLDNMPNGSFGRKLLEQFFDSKKICSFGGFDEAESLRISVVTSWDPNDKAGPAGFDFEGTPPDQLKHFIVADHSFGYMVFFENLETATAAAQEVLITDQIDSNLDWSTFSFGDMQIGDKTVSVPDGSTSFITEVDLRPDMNALVYVNCTFNLSSGVTECLFQGKDPITGELADFLPPNTDTVDPKGKGWISYSIKPKRDLPTGTVISNKATIDFEVGIPPEPMDTPEVFNTIDSGNPTSIVLPMPLVYNNLTFPVSWSGNDDAVGSGIKNFDIYVSDNEGPFTLWTTTSDTSATFIGDNGHTYYFYSRARDNVGNVEDAPTSSDASTTILQQLMLTVNKTGTGSGTVTADNGAMSWSGNTGTAAYDYNSSVTLTALADTGSTFAGWSGEGCTGTGTCNVTMDTARTVTATFTLNQIQNQYTMTVSKSGTGSGMVTGSPKGIDKSIKCGADCSANYLLKNPNKPIKVTLTAKPSTDSIFVRWEGDCAGTGKKCSVLMGGNKIVTAKFDLIPEYTLTVNKSGTGSGMVTGSPKEVDKAIKCGADCSANYLLKNPNKPKKVTLTAKPSTDSIFVRWEGDCAGTGTKCSMLMDGDKTVTAKFDPIPRYTLTSTKDGDGGGIVTGSPNGIDKAINCGVDCAHDSAAYLLKDANKPLKVTLKAKADMYSVFSGWSGACTGTGTCIVTMDSDKTVTAKFTTSSEECEGGPYLCQGLSDSSHYTIVWSNISCDDVNLWSLIVETDYCDAVNINKLKSCLSKLLPVNMPIEPEDTFQKNLEWKKGNSLVLL